MCDNNQSPRVPVLQVPVIADPLIRHRSFNY
jgi:hypothetical protein